MAVKQNSKQNAERVAEKFAKKLGFVGVRDIPSWRGFDCFEALYADVEPLEDAPYIGYPQLVFVNGGFAKMATFEETLDYMAEVVSDGE